MPYREGSDVTCSNMPAARYPAGNSGALTGLWSKLMPAFRGLQRAINDLARFAQNGVQMSLAMEALRVNLVDVFRTRWPGCKPAAGRHHFYPTDWRVIPGSACKFVDDRLTGEVRFRDGVRREPLQAGFLLRSGRSINARVIRLPELRRQLAIVLARISTCMRSDLGCEQVHDRSVLICRPDGTVETQEAGPGTLLTAETGRAIEEAGREPFEPDRNLGQVASELLHHSVDHAAADHRLPYCGIRRPPGTVREKVA